LVISICDGYHVWICAFLWSLCVMLAYVVGVFFVCVCLRIVVSNTYCAVVFFIGVFVLCLCCQLLCWIVHVQGRLLLRHSLMFNKYKHWFYFCK
jgi:hypothetical protein